MQVFVACNTYTGATMLPPVQRYIQQAPTPPSRTVPVPLGRLPGQRLEADFRRVHVEFPDGRRQIPFLVTAWAYSNAPFVLALPFGDAEAILEGMVRALSVLRLRPQGGLVEQSQDLPSASSKDANGYHPRHAAAGSQATSSIACSASRLGRGEAQRRGPSQIPRPASSRAGRSRTLRATVERHE